MNRNTIIGLVLILGLFILWGQFMPKEEIETATATEEQTDDKSKQAKESPEPIVKNNKPDEQVLITGFEQSTPQDSKSEYQQLRKQFGVFVHSSQGDEEFITVENEVMKMRFTTKGGRVYSVELKDYRTYDTSQPVILFDSDSTRFGYIFNSIYPVLLDTIWTHQEVQINTNDFYFQSILPEAYSGSNSIIVSKDDSLTFKFRLYPDASNNKINSDKYLEFVYTVYGNQYMIDYSLNLKDLKGAVSPLIGDVFKLDWKAHLRQQERTQDRLNGTTIQYREDYESKSEYDYLSENSDDSLTIINGRLRWVSMKQRFFATTLISRNSFLKKPTLIQYFEKAPSDTNYLQTMKVDLEIPINNVDNSSSQFSFYFGPLKYKTLRSYDLGLERQIPLGWSFPYILSWINRFAVIPVFDWLGGYGWNYGIVILLLTIMLKIVLFPIAYKTYRSTAKMRVLKPEIDEISKKFPKKEDSMKKQQATMALYKKAGVNPMAGCVPMLLQFPILIALFRFFPSSIELRQQSFLWAHDLSSYDSIARLPFEIPFYGDHVSLFTLLMTVSTIIYTWMNNQMMSSSQQMPGMKTMMYLMPIMFLGIFNNYASGLSYYYFLANIITFGQMFVIRRTINEDKIYKKLQEHKKKPKKQSGFQKRLDEAAKKRNKPHGKKK